jgi:hypothetical protein
MDNCNDDNNDRDLIYSQYLTKTFAEMGKLAKTTGGNPSKNLTILDNGKNRTIVRPYGQILGQKVGNFKRGDSLYDSIRQAELCGRTLSQ